VTQEVLPSDDPGEQQWCATQYAFGTAPHSQYPTCPVLVRQPAAFVL
jgi:hypothetical protein